MGPDRTGLDQLLVVLKTRGLKIQVNRERGVAFVMITHDDRLAQAAERILLIEDDLIHEISKTEHRKRAANLSLPDLKDSTYSGPS